MERAMTRSLAERLLTKVRRKARAVVRHRAFLLSLAVVPQILALAVLVGIFWFVRVREVLVVPVRIARANGAEVLRCSVPSRDLEKIRLGASAEVEILGPADQVEVAGRGVVVGMARTGRDPCSLDIGGSGVIGLVRRVKVSGSARGRVAVRTRRALTVIMESRGGTAGQTG